MYIQTYSTYMYISLLIGLDLHRPVVFEHSKRLLGNLIVLLACREDYTAACEARLTQYDMFMQSSSNVSLSGQEDATELERYGSVCSMVKREGTVQTSLSQRVRDLIKFVSLRYGHDLYMYMYNNYTVCVYIHASFNGSMVHVL